ncbi:10328_t:CDS:2 [Funneliformis geosporum]|nr:10328_t:CDS:2 [Funneliformis geosporum]
MTEIKTKKKYRKHTESYISSKARIVVGEIILKDERKNKYGEEMGFRGYPHTQHYSFLNIDRNLFDFERVGNDLKQGEICVFEYYRDNGGYPLLISAQKTEGKKKHLEKM